MEMFHLGFFKILMAKGLKKRFDSKKFFPPPPNEKFYQSLNFFSNLLSVISPVPDKPCNTQDIFYSHNSPYYLPHRGGCVCYSGDIICAKEDFTKAFKKEQIPTGRWLNFAFVLSSKSHLLHIFSSSTTRGSLFISWVQQEGCEDDDGGEEGGE